MENKTGKYFKYAIGEIVLVVIGILIALQINNWNENRKAKAQEVSSMEEIIKNLNYDILRCQKNTETNRLIIHGLDSLRTSLANTINGKDETRHIYYYALKYSTDFSTAVLNSATYDEMTNSGLIKGIKNKKLVAELADYYERISTSVLFYEPNTSHKSMLNIHRKFISYMELEDYIQSFDSMNEGDFSSDYNFKNLQKMEDLELLKPNGLTLTDYYNEISQFEIDLKTYLFYMSWTLKSAKKLIEDIENQYHLASHEL